MADCEDHIAKNDESMKEETGIRTKENGACQESKACGQPDLICFVGMVLDLAE